VEIRTVLNIPQQSSFAVQMRKVLVIGASGQVGREILASLARGAGDVQVEAASRSDPNPGRRLALERPETVESVIKSIRPNHVVLAAAATHVAWCEEHPSEAWAMNVAGTQAVATSAASVDATCTFISTDYVFDGRSGPNSEDDTPNPINVYGTQKLEAESAVMAANPGNLIVRTCQVFGADPRRTNFVVRVADGLLRGDRISAAGDMFGTPTYAPDLADAIVYSTLSGARGIWHVGGDTLVSRHELAIMVAKAFGRDLGLIDRVSANDLKDVVDRPRYAGVRSTRAEWADLRHVTPLAQALATLAAQEARG
jgi:dTDP-4-dehydrorhamnose reductase